MGETRGERASRRFLSSEKGDANDVDDVSRSSTDFLIPQQPPMRRDASARPTYLRATRDASTFDNPTSRRKQEGMLAPRAR